MNFNLLQGFILVFVLNFTIYIYIYIYNDLTIVFFFYCYSIYYAQNIVLRQGLLGKKLEEEEAILFSP
jgi:hypothetical protein